MTICMAVISSVVLFNSPTVLANEKAIARLKSRGLVQSGNRWVLAEDLALERKSVSLDRAVRQLQIAREHTASLIAQNKLYGEELKRSNERLAQLTRQRQQLSGASNKERRDKVQEQIVALRSRIVALEKAHAPAQQFCERREAREAVTATNAQQQRIVLSLRDMPSQIFLMENKYKMLSEDRQVMQAIILLGPQARLASGANASKYRQRLDRARRVVGSDWIPVHSENGRLRISAIIEEKTPATFTYQRGSGAALLPASVIRKAGIKIPDNAPQATLRCGDGRQIAVRVITVTYLRLGSSLLEGVRAYALPPEGEDLGARITDESLGRYGAQLDLANLRMKISL
jgi:hypothetical protein